MATVIDALIVTLGIDTKNFTQGQAQAKSGMDDIRKKTAQQTEEEKKQEKQKDVNRKKQNEAHEKTKKQTRETSEGFRVLSKDAMAFFGVITTATGLGAFISNITNANSQLYRTANNLGTTTEELTAWGGAVEQAGGNAQSAISTMQMLSHAMTMQALTGQSPLTAYFNRLKVDAVGAMQSANPLGSLLKQITKGIENEVKTSGKTNAFNMLGMMGFDYDMADIVVKGQNEVDKMLEHQKQLGVLNHQQAERSRELARQFTEVKQRGEKLGRTIEDITTPAMTRLLNVLMDFVDSNPKVVAGIGALLLALGPVRGALAGIGLLLGADSWQVWQKGGDSAIGAMVKKLDKLYESAKKAWYAANGAFDDTSKKKVDKETSDILTFLVSAAKATPIGRPVGQVFDLLTRSDKSSFSKGYTEEGIRKTGKNEKEWLARYNKYRFTPEQLKADLLKKGFSQSQIAEQLKMYEGAGLDRNGRINAELNVQNDAYIKQANAQARAALPPSYNQQSNSTSTNSTNVGQIIINSNASDGRGLANDFSRQLVNQAESGAH